MPGWTAMAAAVSTQPANPDIAYEPLGYGTDGALTPVVAGASVSVKGSYVTIGTTVNAWAGFYLEVSQVTASARYALDIRAGGTTIIVPDFYVEGAGNTRVFIPLQVAAGTLLEARSQCTNASSTMRIAVSGRIAAANIPPAFTTMTALTTFDTGTRPSTTAVPTAATIAWTQLVASTAAAYGALLIQVGQGTIPATQQQATAYIAIGGAGSEVQIARMAAFAQTSSPSFVRAYRLIEKAIAAGTRLSAAMLAPAADNGPRVSIHGFS